MTEQDRTKEFIEKTKGGDRSAFDELVRLFSKPLRSSIENWSRFQLGSRVSAEDVLQETFIRAYRSIDKFEWKDDRSFGHWLAGIAKHALAQAAQDARRAERQAPCVSTPSSGTDIGKVLRRGERFDRLQAALEKLGDDHREVIRLCRIEGLTSNEVAERMGRSPAAVRQLLVRALRELKQHFGETESLHLPDRPLRFGEKSDGK